MPPLPPTRSYTYDKESITIGAERSKEPLGLVHTDEFGKMTTQLLGRADYFTMFTDNKTRYCWKCVLKRKDQVFAKFLEWKAVVEKSTRLKLKVLRSDNGGGYMSVKFGNFVKSEVVQHELIVPKTPEQIGVDERMNSTLVKTVRSMLSDAKLPHKFWAEVPSTAVYLTNCSPTRSVEGMTPFEEWTNEKPSRPLVSFWMCCICPYFQRWAGKASSKS